MEVFKGIQNSISYPRDDGDDVIYSGDVYSIRTIFAVIISICVISPLMLLLVRGLCGNYMKKLMKKTTEAGPPNRMPPPNSQMPPSYGAGAQRYVGNRY